MCDIKRGVLVSCLLVGILLLVIPSLYAGYQSVTANTTLTVNLTVDNDFYPTYPLLFTINASFVNSVSAAITNSTGQCYINHSGIISSMDYDTPSQKYVHSIVYTNYSLNQNFTVFCGRTDSFDHNISLSSSGSPVFLEYSVFAPYWIELELDNTTYTNSSNPKVGTNLNYTLYAQVTNYTGQTNSTVTTPLCNVSINGTTYSFTNPPSGVLYRTNVSFTNAGLYNFIPSCNVGQSYDGPQINQTVLATSPTFVNSTLALGHSQGNRRTSLLLDEHSSSILIQNRRVSANRFGIFNLSNNNEVLYNSSISSFNDQSTVVASDFLQKNYYDFLYIDRISTGITNVSRGSGSYANSTISTSLSQLQRQTAASIMSNGSARSSVIWKGNNATSINVTLLSEWTGTAFTFKPLINGQYDGPFCVYDYSEDGIQDIFSSGYTGSQIVSDFWFYNQLNNNFTINGSLTTKYMHGACVATKLFSTSDADLFVYGKTAYGAVDTVTVATPTNFSLISNFTTLSDRASEINLTDFIPPIKSDVIFADFNNDGTRDLVSCGQLSSVAPTVNVTYFYLNHLSVNGTWQRIYPFPTALNISDCSLSALDYDNDGDLDLLVSGVGDIGSGTNPVLLFNNTISDIFQASRPLPPTQINVSYDNLTRQLRFNWSEGDDDYTPSNMLSYNIEVRRLSDNGIVISKLNPLSTNPAQGYYGNAGFRRWYVLNEVTDPNVQVSVQAVSANLMRSDYFTTEFSSCDVPANGIWNITGQNCALTTSVYGPNLSIYVSGNSNLTISQPISFLENTTLTVINGSLSLLSTLNLNGTNLILNTSGRIYSQSGIVANGTFTVWNNSVSNVTFVNSTTEFYGNAQLFNSNFTNSSINSTGYLYGLNNTYSRVNIISGNMSSHNYLFLTFADQFSETVTSFYTSDGNTNTTFSSPRTLLTAGHFAVSNSTYNQTFIFSKSGYYPRTLNFSINSSTTQSIQINRTPQPLFTGFDLITDTSSLISSNQTSDVSSLSNVTNFTVGVSSVGVVTLTGQSNVSFANLSNVINISHNFISINTTADTRFNTTLRLSLLGVPYTKQPVIYRDGSVCSDCVLVSYLANNVTFTSPHASNYTTGNNSDIELLSSESMMQNVFSNISVAYVNVSNTSQKYSGSCYLTTDSTTNTNTVGGAMTYDGTDFYYLKNFTNTDTFNVSVTCTGNSIAEPLTKQFEVSVLTYGIYFILDKSFTGVSSGSTIFYENGSNRHVIFTGLSSTGSYTGKIVTNNVETNLGLGLSPSSLGIADLVNNGNPDLLFQGSTSASNHITGIYRNFTQSVSLGSLTSGSVAIADFDRDGDVDILSCGETSLSLPKTYLYRNEHSLANASHTIVEPVFISATTSIVNLSSCAILTYDFNKDSYPDIIISGKYGNVPSQISSYYYMNSGGSFIEVHNFTGISTPSMTLINSSNKLLLVISGVDSITNPQTIVVSYNSTNNSFYVDTDLESQLPDLESASLVLGDFYGNESTTLFVSGLFQFNQIISRGYSFNGTNFTAINSIYTGSNTSSGSTLLADILGNNNLDLFVTGQSGPSTYVSQLYKNTAYLINPPVNPTTPSGLAGNYNSTTQILNLSWTPQSNRTYNVRVGNTTNSNAFVSGVITSSSNPTQGQVGNMFGTPFGNWTMPDACFVVQVQSIDRGYRRSAWSSAIYVNNITETCDAFDNDCDSLIDEPFRALNPSLFRYNTSGTLCTFYEQNFPQKLACNPDSTGSGYQGTSCGNSGVNVWNTTTHECDCVNQTTTTSTTVRANTGGTTSGIAPSRTLPTTATTTDTTTRTDTTTQKPPETTPPTTEAKPAAPPLTSSQKAAREVEVEYKGGRSYITEIVRNKQRTTITDMTVRKTFPKDVLESASLLTSVTPFTIIEEDPIIDFHLGEMGYLQSKPLVYSIPGKVDVSQIEQLGTQIITQQELSEEQIAQTEAKQEAKAATALNVTIGETVIGNQTQLTIDLNLTENITSVQNVEIEQFIPKCLINEITQTILEAGVDKSLLNSVTIKEADPIIVWNLQEVSDVTKLTLNINGLRPEDCDDEIKIKTLAREYIKANYEINPVNLSKSLLLTVGIFVLFLTLYLISNYLKSNHEDAQVHEVVKRILKRFHSGISLDKVKAELYADKLSPSLIDTALSHIRSEKLEKRHKFWHAVIENGIQIFIFTTALVLNSMEFFGFLPGYLDWIKKVLSWVLIILLLYDANLTKVVFNNSKRWINVTLLLGMFCMYLKSIVIYAKTKSLDDNTYFIFDLYAFVLNHNHFFTTTLFFIGAGLILFAAIAMAWTLQVKEGCLYFTFSHHPNAHTLWQKLKRSGKLFAIFMFFGFSIFNRVVEWLGVAIDTTVFMVVIIIILFLLASTSFVNTHTAFKRHIVEAIVKTLTKNSIWILFLSIFVFSFIKPFLDPIASQGVMGMFGALILVIALYTLRSGVQDHFEGLQKMSAIVDEATTKFIKLFSHPSTIFLGISGLFLLQHIVEIALYIIPNITGQADSDYSQYAVNTLLGLFSDTSIIAAHLFTLDVFSRFVVGSIYAISIIGSLFLFLVPLVVWALYFIHRHTHPSQVSIRDMFFDKTNSFYRLCQFILVFAVPSILVSIATKVLTISYASNLTDTSYVGIIISAKRLMISSDSAFILLLGYLLYILMGWFLQSACVRDPLRTQQPSKALVSLTVIISFTSLFVLYVVPYVLSIIAYIGTLLSSAAAANSATMVLYWILITQFWFDIIVVYICGSFILIFFGLPRTVKMMVIEALSHIPFFHHLFFLASSLTHIDYYADACEKYSGNVIAHVKNYLQTLEEEGHHLETIVYQLKIHNYPQQIINTAISELVRDKKFIHSVEHIKAEHLSVHQVKKLVPMIKSEFAKNTTVQEMYELFMDRFTHAEIKLSILYACGDLKGDITLERVTEIEDTQLRTVITLVKKEVAQNKTSSQIVSELTTQGYDAELVLKILEHPLFNKQKAQVLIDHIIKELQYISRSKNLDESLVRLFSHKYAYPLFVRAFNSKEFTDDKLIKSLSQIIVWVVAAMNKGYTREQMTQALISHKWQPNVISAVMAYATFVVTSAHHVDLVIEKDYIELSE